MSLSLGLRQDLSLVRERTIAVTEMSQDNKFIVPYRRNVHFTGRAELLKNLDMKLSDTTEKEWNHRVALYGLGGIGKTQLALEYVHSRKDNYERIYWISAVNKGTLLAGYQDIAKRTNCVPAVSELKASEVAEKVLEWLKFQKSWLLIIDNLDQIEAIDGYLPHTSPTQHTLITTRNPYCDDIPAEGLKVEPLDIDDAIDLLLDRSKLEDAGKTPEARVEAEKIVNELGSLPLAIEQAAAYIREASRDLFKFLPIYQKNRKKYLARPSKANRSYYTETVVTTWRLSFDQIAKNTPDAPKLLQLLSFLNPDGILTDFLDAGKEGLSDELKEIVADDDRFYEALSELERFSLIGRQKDSISGQRITIHRLVQSVIRDDMSAELFSSFTTAVLGVCHESFPIVPNEIRAINRVYKAGERELCRRYQSQMVEPLLQTETVRTEKCADIKERLANFLTGEGNHSDAERLRLQVIRVRTELLSIDHRDTVTGMHKLAWTYMMQGRIAEAVKLQEEVVERRKRTSGEEQLETLISIHSLAHLYSYQGRISESAKLQEEVRVKMNRTVGEDDPATLLCVHTLAWVYSQQGRIADAEKLQEEVMEKMKRTLGEDHINTLWAVNNLALTYFMQGRLTEAASLQKELVDKNERLWGEDYLDTLVAMSNLALTYSKEGRIAEAVKLQEDVVERRKRISAGEHPSMLMAMNNLAWTYARQGRIVEAIKLLEEALEKQKEVLGEAHPDTQMMMKTLELMRRQTEGTKKSEDIAEEQETLG